MKNSFNKFAGTFVVALVAVIAFLSVAANAQITDQNKPDKKQQKSRARDLYIEYQNNASQGLPGAKVRVLLNRNGQERYVTPNETFYSGDRIRLVFKTNFAGHVALLNLGSSGKINLLYPYKGASSAVVANGKNEIQIPSRDWIRFDERAGEEKISIIFSRNPLQSVEQVIGLSVQNSGTAVSNGGNATVNNGTIVNNTTVNNTTLNNPTVNNTTLNNSPVTSTNVNANNGSEVYVATSSEAQQILQELNARSLKRAKSRDLYIETANSDATYIVANANLISEPTAFVINLRHERRR